MFSRLYGAIIKTRNSLYETGALKSFALGVPVVSVGNITVGGTGKTPLVALVATIFLEHGETVGILTRGYGRENPKSRVLVADGENILADARRAGDEPFELAVKLSGKAIIIADANRVAAGNWAREKFGATVFVLDDAFQHRRVKRDLNIVCIDATNPFGNGKLLPSGILREPLENLKRADAIVITRANLIEDVSNLESQILKYNSHCPIFVSENKISHLIELNDFHTKQRNYSATNDKLQPTTDNYLAFCALGNPENFYEQLRREKFNLTATQTFPDHYLYTPSDIEKLSAKARQTGAKNLLTTAKDAVKLKNLNFNIPCLVIENEMIFSGEEDFRRWLTKSLTKK